MDSAIRNRRIAIAVVAVMVGAVTAWGALVARWVESENSNQAIVLPMQSHLTKPSSERERSLTANLEMSSDMRLILARQIDGDDAGAKRDAIQQIELLSRTNPQALGLGLTAWTGPLIRAGQYQELASIALPVILDRSFDPTIVQAAQRARVLAFTEAGNFPQALKEAKAYYNIASLSKTADAVNLLARILRQMNDVMSADSLEAQQRRSEVESEILSAAEIDIAPYTAAIEEMRRKCNRSGASHNNLMSLANLLLLTGQATEAQQWFQAACKTEKTSGQSLRQAMEGIAKAQRDQDGNVSNANAFITSIRQNPSDAAKLIANPAVSSWEEFRIVAQQIQLCNLPTQSLPALEQRRQADENAACGAGQLPTVVSGFEGSTPVHSVALSPTHIVVEITTSGFRDWFMFRLQGVANKTVRVDITGAYKNVPDWAQKNWSLNPVYSCDGRLDETSANAVHTEMETVNASNGTKLPPSLGQNWRYVTDTWNDDYTLSCVVHFYTDATVAMRVPRTPTFNEKFLEDLQTQSPAAIEQIGFSVSGRPLLAAKIGAADPGKPCVLIYAGEHADEQDAGWVAQGAIEYLVGDMPEAAELRRRYTFIVIPQLDPDASAAGIHQSVISSFLPDRFTAESAAYANWFQKWVDSGNRIDVAIDLHNIQSGEGPHVFCPLIESTGSRGTLSLAMHKAIVKAIQGAGYGVQLNPQMRGWMPDRLCGWLSHYFGTVSIPYEVNSQAPERHLSIAETKGLGRVFVQAIGRLLSGVEGRALLAEVDKRQQQRAQQWAGETQAQLRENAIVAEARVAQRAIGLEDKSSSERVIP